jgi:hyperosmotically inducible protein
MSVSRRIGILAAAVLACSGCLPSDAALHREVRARLDSDPATAGLAVDVTHRVVYLSGTAMAAEDQRKAMDVARSVESVKLVINRMSLDGGALAAKVKAALTADPVLGQLSIDTEVKDGTVYLRSTQTDAEQRERAVRVAKAVDGVGRVEDLMK